MYERGYVVSSDGNISVRIGDKILATPTMTCKGRMTPKMLAITDLEGKRISGGRPSSELAMHLLIYREREDVKAVCHAHPPHGTAFAVAGLAIDKPILSEVILTLGCVPLTRYGTPSTAELTDAMQPYVRDHNALLMANHGAAILAKILGGANDLPPDAISKLINIREKAGYLGENARCQACGYLHNSGVACSNERPAYREMNGEKISLSREELIELLSKAANLS